MVISRSYKEFLASSIYIVCFLDFSIDYNFACLLGKGNFLEIEFYPMIISLRAFSKR